MYTGLGAFAQMVYQVGTHRPVWLKMGVPSKLTGSTRSSTTTVYNGQGIPLTRLQSYIAGLCLFRGSDSVQIYVS